MTAVHHSFITINIRRDIEHLYAKHVARTSTSAFGVWALTVHTSVTSVLSAHPLGVCFYPFKYQDTPRRPFACTHPSRAHHVCTEYFYVYS